MLYLFGVFMVYSWCVFGVFMVYRFNFMVYFLHYNCHYNINYKIELIPADIELFSGLLNFVLTF